MAAVPFLPCREGIVEQTAGIFNARRFAVSEAARAASDSDYRWPRSRRPRERQGLELEKLGYLAADVSEDDGQGRAAEHRQRSQGGRSDAEPKPHRHGDLIGIEGRN
jgi:hypothetical protein